jgi:hypothetical protein
MICVTDIMLLDTVSPMRLIIDADLPKKKRCLVPIATSPSLHIMQMGNKTRNLTTPIVVVCKVHVVPRSGIFTLQGQVILIMESRYKLHLFT